MTSTDQPGHKKPSPAMAAFMWFALLAVVAAGGYGIYELASDDVALVDPAATPTAGPSDGATPGAEGAGGAAGDGTIAAGGATVYPLQADLSLADFAGNDVVATNVPVESTAGKGFWVGTTAKDRVYVLAPKAKVKAGDVVSFEGVVRKHGKNYAKSVNVTKKKDAKRLNSLRGHIEAGKVTAG